MKFIQKHFEKQSWYPDYYRFTDDYHFVLHHFIKDFIFHHNLRCIIYYRKANSSHSKVKLFYYKWHLFRMSRKYGLEIKNETKIGPGLCLTHPYNITISPFAEIGCNCTFLKGATIGLSKGGAPRIGDNVVVGLNSTVLGGITIGNNVLIAPNTLVNVDVPDNSVVIGSPCKIVHKEQPTSSFLWKTYEKRE